MTQINTIGKVIGNGLVKAVASASRAQTVAPVISLGQVTGKTGLSAYQLAVLDGFVGTEIEWQASIKGAKGDVGASPSAMTATFSNPSQSWQVLHNLNRRVSVQVLDDFGNVVLAEVQHTSLNEFYVRFGSPQSGSAIYI